MKSQRETFIPPPTGNTKVENPDGNFKTSGSDVPHSAYDAAFFGDGYGYGAFTREGDGPFLFMHERKRESTKRED